MTSTRKASYLRGNRKVRVSSLLDVVLHKSNSACKSSVVDFPFSDHSIVFAKLYILRVSEEIEVKLSRKFNSANIKLITDCVNSLDFTILDTISNVNVRWHLFKKIILNILDSFVLNKKLLPKKHVFPGLMKNLT
jgi:hypothetical protein